MDFSLLTDPVRFFDDRADDPRLLPPALLVLATALVSAVTGGVYGQKLVGVLPPQVQGVGQFFVLVTAGGGFVTAFFGWVVVTVVFYLVSLAFDGEGPFTTLLAFVGWGYAPAVASALVTLALTVVVLQGVTFPSDPQSLATAVREYQRLPLVRLASVLSIVFTLWQAFIWTFGVAYARDLSRREAAITVGVPVGLFLLWNAYSLI